MKKYQPLNETQQKQATRQQLNALLLFQFQLRNSEELNDKFHGKAHEIANGLQPWIDALEISMQY